MKGITLKSPVIFSRHCKWQGGKMKLYVGNLPWSIDDNKLKEIFSEFDVQEATVITDKFSRRSKGFGFVTIEDDESAQKAISSLNGKEVEGREIKVNEAKPRE